MFFINIWSKIKKTAVNVWQGVRSFFLGINKRLLVAVASVLAIVVICSLIADVAITTFLPEAPEEIGEETITIDPTSERIVPGEISARIPLVQTRLAELGYMEAHETTEYYGPETQAAVRCFKTANNLGGDALIDNDVITALFSENASANQAEDTGRSLYVENAQAIARRLSGIVAAKTEETADSGEKVALLRERTGVSASSDAVFPENTEADVFAYSLTALSLGTHQSQMNALGYLTPAPTGEYDELTVDRIFTYRSKNDMLKTASAHSALMTTSAEQDVNVLSEGSFGAQVAEIQQNLADLGYMEKVTGYYDAATVEAVTAFQTNNGISVNGNVGASALEVLLSEDVNDASFVPEVTEDLEAQAALEEFDKTIPYITGANVESLISVAESKLGCKYVGGAKGPNRFDCSGFVYWCLKQIGINNGYMSSYAWRSCRIYEKITDFSDIQAGDIIVQRMGGRRGHVAIAVDDTMMIDASSNKGKIVKRPYRVKWVRESFYCAYRIF